MFRLHVNVIAFLKNIEKQMNLPDTKLHLLLNSLSDRFFFVNAAHLEGNDRKKISNSCLMKAVLPSKITIIYCASQNSQIK